MKRAEIEDQNRYLLRQQHDFRRAADIVTDALMTFDEVEAVAVIGSVAKPLWKEVPRFREFRRAGIEVWHECKDVDLAVWISSQLRLGELRRARDLALRRAFESGRGPGTANHQVEIFLIEPGTDKHLGRLCDFNECRKASRIARCRVAAPFPSTNASTALRHTPICWPPPHMRCSTGEARGVCALRSTCRDPTSGVDLAAGAWCEPALRLRFLSCVMRLMPTNLGHDFALIGPIIAVGDSEARNARTNARLYRMEWRHLASRLGAIGSRRRADIRDGRGFEHASTGG